MYIKKRYCTISDEEINKLNEIIAQQNDLATEYLNASGERLYEIRSKNKELLYIKMNLLNNKRAMWEQIK